MRKFTILFAIISLLYSCRNNDNDFKDYWEKIPVINLPLTITCGLCNADTLIRDSLIRKYAFEGAEVVGRLEDKKNVCIIYSYPGDICYPYLYVYNQQGKKLDSLYLHISTCTDDQFLSYRSWSVIHSDKSIAMTDTEKHFMIDTIKRQRFLQKILIHHRNYKLNKEGIPEVISSQKDSEEVHKLSP